MCIPTDELPELKEPKFDVPAAHMQMNVRGNGWEERKQHGVDRCGRRANAELGRMGARECLHNCLKLGRNGCASGVDGGWTTDLNGKRAVAGEEESEECCTCNEGDKQKAGSRIGVNWNNTK